MLRTTALVTLLVLWLGLSAGLRISAAGSLAYQIGCDINIIEFNGETPGAEIRLKSCQDWESPQWLDESRLLGIRGGNIWMAERNGRTTQLTQNGQVGRFIIIPGTDCLVFTRELLDLNSEPISRTIWKMRIGQAGERIKTAGNRSVIQQMTATGDNVFWVEFLHTENSPKHWTRDRIMSLSLQTGQVKTLYQTGQNGKWEEIFGLCRSWEKGKLLFVQAPYESTEPDTSKLYNIYLVSVDEKTGATKRVCQFCKPMGQGATIAPGPVPESIFLTFPTPQGGGITLIYPKRGGIWSPFCWGWEPCFSRPYGE